MPGKGPLIATLGKVYQRASKKEIISYFLFHKLFVHEFGTSILRSADHRRCFVHRSIQAVASEGTGAHPVRIQKPGWIVCQIPSRCAWNLILHHKGHEYSWADFFETSSWSSCISWFLSLFVIDRHEGHEKHDNFLNQTPYQRIKNKIPKVPTSPRTNIDLATCAQKIKLPKQSTKHMRHGTITRSWISTFRNFRFPIISITFRMRFMRRSKLCFILYKQLTRIYPSVWTTYSFLVFSIARVI